MQAFTEKLQSLMARPNEDLVNRDDVSVWLKYAARGLGTVGGGSKSFFVTSGSFWTVNRRYFEQCRRGYLIRGIVLFFFLVAIFLGIWCAIGIALGSVMSFIAGIWQMYVLMGFFSGLILTFWQDGWIFGNCRRGALLLHVPRFCGHA